MKNFLIILSILFASQYALSESLTDYVNPFIGTTNYGTTNPGAIMPHGMVTVAPFNVMGSSTNKFDKDSQWLSTGFEYTNSYVTGLSHNSLSGVGCPELGSLLLMPTTGKLEVDFTKYGSKISQMNAVPGNFSCVFDKYEVVSVSSATVRSGITEFTFPEGESNILFNLGEGLTNESGSYARFVSDTEIEGMKLQGTFCYNSQAVFPVYFVLQVSKSPAASGYWKKQRPMTAEAAWDDTAGKYKLYERYNRDIAGDDIGVYFKYNTAKNEKIAVKIGISYVSIANARENLRKEQPGFDFEKVKKEARESWEKELSRVIVEGGTHDEKVVFYTALYHALIHPNILNDVNGQYPAMESGKILTTDRNRYTVFSLWDTYRNVHQLLTLLYPEKQTDMVRSLVEMYKESGWLPRWELYGRETLTMEGDPAIPVIVDSWMKGLRDFDVNTAYEAMYKSATTAGSDNFIRSDNDDYLKLGYVPLRAKYDNSVSHALEYYIADNALAKFAAALGKKEDAVRFKAQSLNYKKYYSPEYGVFRPILPDGTFLSPFNPKQGENFEDVPGFHEGSSWNYSFMVPHDIPGLIKMHGGNKKFTHKLQEVFDDGHYDPTNEPNIGYPYLFNYVKGEEWRTQKLTRELLEKHFRNAPDGLPGNDDTGTMSVWAVFSMMGFYPVVPADMSYAVTSPVFDKITIQLDTKYYPNNRLVIEKRKNLKSGDYIRQIKVNNKKVNGNFLNHNNLTTAGSIILEY
ncbi:MAG: GH92 family glycosyl hydrolase [Paludibacteraceae bacterium]